LQSKFSINQELQGFITFYSKCVVFLSRKIKYY